MDLPGRFGTIALLRQNTPDDVVTSFGVDTPAVSFGRDPNCSVRLYYPDVAPIHARIVFHDKKAFLEVLGEQGLIVDGCQVFPTKTIALGNGSELHIHGKRFRFTYPPKDMRAALAASPARPANRALRLSMIASAQVFSPRPSPNPRENLRVLQSPMRAPPRTRTPSPSPTKSHTPPEPETITLVQGSSPRVVEDEKDLVILEDVEVTPAPQAQLIIAAPPKTPRRQSLHRAVLIRSAHRAVLAATAAPTPNSNSSGGSGPTTPAMNTGPAKESSSSRSVSPNKGKFSVPADDTDTDTDTEEEEEEVRALGLEVVSVSSGSDSEGDEDEDDAQEEEPQQRIGWRKSLERLWPFGRVKTEEEEAVLPDAPADVDTDEDDEETEIHEQPTVPTPVVSPKRKTVSTPAQNQRSPTKTPTPAARAIPASTTPFGIRRSPEKTSAPVHTPLGPRSPIKATSRSTSPQKNVDMPQKQINAEFGVPHPSARTPPGFGRRSGAASNAVVPAKERTESPVVPMEVDSEPPYQSLYADLAIDASAIQQEKPTTTRTESPARAKPSRLVNLADFMTPQAPRTGAAAFRTAKNPVGGLPQTRHSLAGILGPQRIRIEDSPWKKSEPLVTPARPMAPPPTPVRPTVSEEERRAIQERRRSGLNAPDMFWADGAPGLSPRKSPTKKTLAGVKEAASSDNEEADPTAMLREMLDTVDVLKKRRESIMADVGRKSLGGIMAAAPLVLLNEAPDGAAEMEVDAEVPAPVPALAPARKTVRRGRQATATPPPEPEEDVTQKPTPSPSKPARRGRKVAAPAIVEPQIEAEVEVEPPKPRRGRKATAEPESVGEDSEEPAALLTIPSAPTKTRRGRSASKEPESEPVPAKTRRGRTATVEPESDAEAPVPATRRPRKPPSTNNAQPVVPATEPAVPATRRGRPAATPASAPERKTRARSRAVNEDDDDPLDSIMADPEIEVVAVVAPKRRGASTKRQAPSSKAVKEEEAEPVLEPTRKAPAAPKPRSTRKGAATPASAPALLVEKENARAGGEDSEEVVEPVKVRVSRSRKAKETASEVVESEAAAPTARRTRTRTRT